MPSHSKADWAGSELGPIGDREKLSGVQGACGFPGAQTAGSWRFPGAGVAFYDGDREFEDALEDFVERVLVRGGDAAAGVVE
jgi:hypothetical protein